MDETDMEAGTDRAQAVDAPAAPQVPPQRQLDPPSHFDTPSWLGPRPAEQIAPTPPPPAPTSVPAPAPAPPVPVQAMPAHESVAAPVQRDTAIISEGRWVESAPPRKLAGAFFVTAMIGLIATVVAAAISQSPVAIAGAIACAVIVVVFRGALMSSGVTTTELKNGRLTVSRDGIRDIFNLNDPVHLVELVGSPTDPAWRLRLETIDGRIVELTQTHVKATELHPAVAHYRTVAEAERRDRERRFNR